MLKYNLSQIDNLSKKILSKIYKTDCIYLFGELGSGKTTFARSLIHQLQEKNKIHKTEVLSPTFNLLHEYQIKSFKGKRLIELKFNKQTIEEYFINNSVPFNTSAWFLVVIPFIEAIKSPFDCPSSRRSKLFPFLSCKVPYSAILSGISVKLLTRTAPFIPCGPMMTPKQSSSDTKTSTFS